MGFETRVEMCRMSWSRVRRADIFGTKIIEKANDLKHNNRVIDTKALIMEELIGSRCQI